jgi:hypothetical protein
MDAPSPGTLFTTALAGVGLTAVHPRVTVAAVIPAALFLAQRWIRRRVPLADLRTPLLTAVVGGVTGIAQVLGTLSAAGTGRAASVRRLCPAGHRSGGPSGRARPEHPLRLRVAGSDRRRQADPIPGLRGLDQVRGLKLVRRNSPTTIYAVSSQIVGG